MTRILYYPGTFFLENILKRRGGSRRGFDIVEYHVKEHIESFLLLLLVFDEVHLPLDNFQFLASETDYCILKSLLLDHRFRRLAEQGLLTTNEHDSHDLKASWELYEQRKVTTKWFIKDLEHEIPFDYIKNIHSYPSKPQDQSARFTNRLDEILEFLFSDNDLQKEQENWLISQYKQSFDDYRDGSFSAEHLVQRIILSGVSEIPKEIKDSLLKSINRAFFETFADKKENTFSYTNDSIVITNPQIQMKEFGSMLYAPKFIKPWLLRFISTKEYSHFIDCGSNFISLIRSHSSWRPFVEYYHSSFSESLIENYIETTPASEEQPIDLKHAELLKSEQLIDKVLDVSMKESNASFKLSLISSLFASFLSDEQKKSISRRSQFFSSRVTVNFLENLRSHLRPC
jgi:hypothetical protein